MGNGIDDHITGSRGRRKELEYWKHGKLWDDGKRRNEQHKLHENIIIIAPIHSRSILKEEHTKLIHYQINQIPAFEYLYIAHQILTLLTEQLIVVVNYYYSHNDIFRDDFVHFFHDHNRPALIFICLLRKFHLIIIIRTLFM
jgi:hypothetical protein